MLFLLHRLDQLKTDLEEKGTRPGSGPPWGTVEMFVLADTSALCNPTVRGRGVGLVDFILLRILN